MFRENTNNNEERENAASTYDYHLLRGHFAELDEIPLEQFSQSIAAAEHYLEESKNKKGTESILLQIDSLNTYASALALKDKCAIEDKEGLLSFICVRHPDLEFDWITLQKMILASTHKNVDYQEQKTLQLAITIYISAIKEKLKA